MVLRVRAEHAPFGTNIAAPLGLIVNELVTNAFKYAFPGNRAGTIEVTFRQAETSGFVLTVRDDGIGLCNASEGLGSRLIRALAHQIDASMTRQGCAAGTVTTITLPQAGEGVTGHS